MSQFTSGVFLRVAVDSDALLTQYSIGDIFLVHPESPYAQNSAHGIYKMSVQGFPVWERAYEEMKSIATLITDESRGAMELDEKFSARIGTDDVTGFRIIVDGVTFAIPDDGHLLYALWAHLMTQANFIAVLNQYPSLRRILWVINATRPSAMKITYNGPGLGQKVITFWPPIKWAMRHRDTMDHIYGPPILIPNNRKSLRRRSSLMLDEIHLLGGWE